MTLALTSSTRCLSGCPSPTAIDIAVLRPIHIVAAATRPETAPMPKLLQSKSDPLAERACRDSFMRMLSSICDANAAAMRGLRLLLIGCGRRVQQDVALDADLADQVELT